METIVMWAIVAILQTQGAVGGAFGDKSGCEEVKGQLIQQQDSIYVSECTPVTLIKKDLTAK